MTEILHLGALGASGLGVCCVALDGPRPRRRELLLAIVMFAAMLDVVTGAAVVPVVVWSALTLLSAMVLAVRRRRGREAAGVTWMRVHSAVGAILMAALMLAMTGGPATGSSHHGASAATLAILLGSGALVFAASSAVRMLRSAHRVEKLQYATMAASLLLLAGALGA